MADVTVANRSQLDAAIANARAAASTEDDRITISGSTPTTNTINLTTQLAFQGTPTTGSLTLVGNLNGSSAVAVSGFTGTNTAIFMGTLTQAGGIVTSDASRVLLNGSLRASGVAFNAADGSILRVAAGSQVTNTSTIVIGGSGSFTVVNAGTITSGDGSDVINTPARVTLLNTGTIRNGTNVAAGANGAGSRITNAKSGLLAGGSGDEFGIGANLGDNGTIDNYGTISGGAELAGGNGTSAGTLSGGRGITANLYAGSSTGTVRLGDDSTLSLYTGTGTSNAVVTTNDPLTGQSVTLQNAGTNAAAIVGGIALGANGVLALRGTGDGTAPNGAVGTLNISTVSGAATLSKQDAGIFVLTGSYANALDTIVSGGRLVASNTAGAFGTGTNTVTIGTNTTVELRNTTGSNISYAGTTFSGAGTLQKTGTGQVSFGEGAATNISLSAGGLIDVQAGVLSGSNNENGVWTNNQGSLNIASGSTFDGVEGTINVNALTGAGTLQGGFNNGTRTTTVGVAGGTGTFSGVIRDSSGPLALLKAGAGTQTLTGGNTYSGATNVSAGTLNIRNATALGTTTGSTSVSSGATLQVQGGIAVGGEALTIAGTGSGTNNGALQNVSGTNTYAGAVTLAGAARINVDTGSLGLSGGITGSAATRALTLGGAAGSGTVSSVIGTNVASVTKDGANTWTLSGANTYAGATTVSAGTLLVDGSTAVNSAVSVSSGATLAGDGTINGTVTVAGTLSASLTASGVATSAGSLATGALTFNDGATYREDIDTTTPAIDRVSANGIVFAAGADVTLDLGITGSLSSSAGQSVTILENTGTGTTSAGFTRVRIGMQTNAVGADNTFAFNGRSYRISYTAVAGIDNVANDIAIIDITPSSGGGGGGTPPSGPTPGNDSLVGTSAADTISLGQGADTFSGGGGADLVYGNQGDDLIYGNLDNDTLYGGQDNDRVYGGQGDDRVFGNAGNDVLFGNAGNDVVYGNLGSDLVYGNQGQDTLFGGQDNDTLFGGQDADIVYGNLGADVVYGNQGADILYGGQGNDVLYGGQGDDTLVGGLGDDILVGGLGADRYVFGANSGRDLILGFKQADGDRIALGGQTYTVSSAPNGDALLTLSGGGVVDLAGIRADQVSANYFAA